MMQSSRIITAIDVGTTKIFTLVASVDNAGNFEALGHGVVPCKGLSKGNIEDIVEAQRAIRESVEEAQKQSGIKINSAFVGITGTHISFENRRDVLDWVGSHGVITDQDISRVPETVANASQQIGRKVLHALPISYSLDGEEGIKDPMGMHSNRLEVETHVVTGSSMAVDRLVRAVESAGVKVDGVVLDSIASSESVLTPVERARGAAVIDIGGGTTDIIVYKGGTISYSAVIPVGGYQFTNDICMTYNTSFEAAEEAKITQCSTEPDTVRPHEEITLPVLGRVAGLRVPRRDVCQLTRERAQELMRLIMITLKNADVTDFENFRLVLTGGGSNMDGLEDMIKRTLTGNVRTAAPNGFMEIPLGLQQPSYSTGFGVLLWGARQISDAGSANGAVNGRNGHANGSRADAKEPVSVGGGKSRFFNPFRRNGK
ncbi:MAG: cell division protein FtsA [SAR202 cluster bacterium Casp-Chloro-G4]|nr:cell division protein FtsA [Chloroflexota bacterium]PKB61916.1 MAG: cell division protein FtsA [SAR202 cluster bacterium Casp-Chloro-G4]